MMPGSKGDTSVDQVGVYRLDKTIGQGTYGKVKLGYHVATGEKVAIKIVQKATIENDRQVKRIQKEVRFLKLLRHPNIVKVYNVLETDAEIFIVMEYAAGGELFDYIVAHKRVKDKEARHFFRQVVSALDYCHSNSVIHRDLKPENLLLDENKNIKIIDFGFSNTFQPNELLNTFCGSPFYAAPEMILGKRYEGPEVDIWSLGVILFALLCGHLPFDDDDVKELYKKISTATYVAPPHLSEEVRQLISRMICVHPKKRATLEEIKLHKWVNEGYTSPPPSFLPEREPITAENVDDELVEKVISFGYGADDIMDKLLSREPSAARETYYLLKEMFDREESAAQMALPIARAKTPPTRLDALLDSIAEDSEGATMATLTPPIEPTLSSSFSGSSVGSTKYPRIIDDFGRRSSQPMLGVEPRTRRLSSPGQMMTSQSIPSGMAGRAASANMQSSSSSTVSAGSTASSSHTTSPVPSRAVPQVRAAPLFPNKHTGNARRAPAMLSPVPELVDGPIFPPPADTPTSLKSTSSASVASSSIAGGFSAPAVTAASVAGAADSAAGSPGTPVAPASAPQRRRMSLSAIEYAAKKSASRSEQKQSEMRTMSGWFSVSTTSNKPVPAILAEVKRVLQASDLLFEFDGNYCYLVEESKEKTTPVCLEIELCKVTRMTLSGLHFKRIRGNIWQYKRICNKLISQLNL